MSRRLRQCGGIGKPSPYERRGQGYGQHVKADLGGNRSGRSGLQLLETVPGYFEHHFPTRGDFAAQGQKGLLIKPSGVYGTLKRTWAEIDLDALAYNYRVLRNWMGSASRFLGVVKADAYGHGAVEVSRTLESLGAEYLAVSNLDEALAPLLPGREGPRHGI